MDSRPRPFSDMIGNYKFDGEIVLPSYEESPNLLNGLGSNDYPSELNLFDSASFSPSLVPGPAPGKFPASSSGSSEVNSPDDNDGDPVLKYLNQILLEENMEDKPSMFHDPLALQAAEKSFYDALGQNYTPSPNQYVYNAGSPDSLFGAYSDCSTNSGTSVDLTEPKSSGGESYTSDSLPSPSPTNPQLPFLSSTGLNSSSNGLTDSLAGQSFASDSLPSPSPTNIQLPFHSSSGISSNSNGQTDSLAGQSYTSDSLPSPSPTNSQLPFHSSNGQTDSLAFGNIFQNIFSDSESILQFQKGREEALKFLPTGNQLFFDLGNYTLPPKSDETTRESGVKIEKKDEHEESRGVLKGRKHLHRQESDVGEQRISKQASVYVEDSELSEMFDRVLLCKDDGAACLGDLSKTEQHTSSLNDSNSGRTRARNMGGKTESVDLRTLLISCAQSVASDDRRTAIEQLKQIRQNSSSTGDAHQRLARVFANGLEARMAGTGTEIYASLASKRISAAEKLKAYQTYLECCPFKKIGIFFTNKMILKTSINASTLHIVDFGMGYGFQWPMLIQHLSCRAGGPPKLRITAIERPQPGLKPSERAEETGRRLAKYCERFNVSFEFQVIALHNWEALNIESLKLVKGECLVVTSMFQFNDLLDETVVVHSPRDAVFRLIRNMNPDIFLNSTSNGAYSAPFFVTRFREALFHYSSLFDIFEATLPRDDPERLNFEQEFYGREAINVIACEGIERVVRPETYKQWHLRHVRAGLKPLPLDKEIMKKLRAKTKAGYHKDFIFDEDGAWMLQGWKGRVIYASSCWTPA